MVGPGGFAVGIIYQIGPMFGGSNLMQMDFKWMVILKTFPIITLGVAWICFFKVTFFGC